MGREAVYSGRCSDLRESAGDRSSYSRTARSLFPEMEGIGLENFSGRWPKAGMMLNGQLLALEPLADRMSARGPVWLPTPTKHLSKEGAYPAEYKRNTVTLTAQLAGGETHVAPNAEFIEWMMGFPLGHTE